MAGRTLQLPDRIERAVPYDNKTNVLLFPVARGKMVARARAKVSPDLRYISKDYLRLNELDTRNAEEVLAVKPDLMLVAAFVGDLASYAGALRFSEKTHIPLVVVDITLDNLGNSYAFLGDLFECPQHAEQFMTFIASVFDLVHQNEANSGVATAYLANGNDGLRTAPGGSRHAELFDIMGIENVAKVPLDSKGFAQVSIEQVLAWNPQYVFCLGKGASSPYRTVLKSALWQSVDAVKNGHVYFVPSEPYPWFDMPPSVNRLLGLLWFSELFSGVSHEVVMEKVTAFYRMFYSYELTEKEYNRLFLWQ